MKTTNIILRYAFFLCHIFLFHGMIHADSGWKNWYGIAWQDSPSNTIKYAKQMGYDYIAAQSSSADVYKNSADAAGLKFYIIDPHSNPDAYIDLPNRSALGSRVEGGKVIDISITYTQEQIDWYNRHMVWKSYDSFPNNFASGFFTGDPKKRITVLWDVQQQAVIDELIENIMQMFKRSENPGLPFTFAGYGMDVPLLSGDFWYINSSGAGKRTTLALWTGTDSGLIHDDITHEYPTYPDGMAAFYKQLNKRMRQDYPDAKWIIEPTRIYDDSAGVVPDEWINSIKNRTDKDELIPDLLLQEGRVTDFVDNSNNFNSGVNIKKNRVGCSQNSAGEEDINRLIAAKAGINGAWYDWFGRFGGSNTMPGFKNITEVYPRLKLVRCIPNWDNLNGIPLAYRWWDGDVYQSMNSSISRDVMYSRQPKTGKLFAVFLTNDGIIRLSGGEMVTSVSRIDGYFMESGDGSDDVELTGSEIRLKSGISIDVDTGNGQVKGNGYIFTLSPGSGVPTVITGPSNNVTSNSAWLTGLVKANGSQTSVWFEYGTISGSYAEKSTKKRVKESKDRKINIGIGELSSQTTYYYRMVARNKVGTTYGEEKSFTTQ